MQCIPCLKYSDLSEVPPKLLRSKRGIGGCQLGMIAKKTETGKEHIACDIRRAMKVHMESDLHVWCAVKDEIVKTERKIFD